MTKYNLEEFQAWLAEKPERRKKLNWENNYCHFKTNEIFTEFIEKGFDGSAWIPYHQVVLEWKAEVDQRERERAGGKQ